MLTRLMKTDHGRVTTFIRLVLGGVMFPHGAQKVFGWFGGYGWSGSMGFFNHMGIPTLFGALAILAEFLGSLGLISGFLTRVAAFGILCNMIVAVALVHLPNGFFMNWTGTQKGEGFEYHILAGTLALYLIVRGGGDASADAYLTTGKFA